MSKFPVACIGVICSDEKILMVKEGKDAAQDTWALPGGSLEPNEKLESCIEREIMEETGLKARAKELIGTYIMEGDAINEKMFIFAFKCETITNEPNVRNIDSVQEAKFINSERIEELNLRFEQIKKIISGSRNLSSQSCINYV